ncbi:MAG: addiction module protein [Kiritimatiellia bacterium]
MHITIPLDKMTAADKLQAMEEIWANLSLVADDVPSPTWHADVLRAREQRISDGRSRFLDITEAKAVVRELIR